MEFFLDFALLAVLIIGITAFLGSISALIMRPFRGKKPDVSLKNSIATKQGWKKVDGFPK